MQSSASAQMRPKATHYPGHSPSSSMGWCCDPNDGSSSCRATASSECAAVGGYWNQLINTCNQYCAGTLSTSSSSSSSSNLSPSYSCACPNPSVGSLIKFEYPYMPGVWRYRHATNNKFEALARGGAPAGRAYFEICRQRTGQIIPCGWFNPPIHGGYCILDVGDCVYFTANVNGSPQTYHHRVTSVGKNPSKTPNYGWHGFSITKIGLNPPLQISIPQDTIMYAACRPCPTTNPSTGNPNPGASTGGPLPWQPSYTPPSPSSLSSLTPASSTTGSQNPAPPSSSSGGQSSGGQSSGGQSVSSSSTTTSGSSSSLAPPIAQPALGCTVYVINNDPCPSATITIDLSGATIEQDCCGCAASYFIPKHSYCSSVCMQPCPSCRPSPSLKVILRPGKYCLEQEFEVVGVLPPEYGASPTPKTSSNPISQPLTGGSHA